MINANGRAASGIGVASALSSAVGLGFACVMGMAHADGAGYPWQPTPSYSFSRIDQFSPTSSPDILPKDSGMRNVYARAIAMEAAIYGLPSVLQYVEMYQQAVDRSSDRYVGFNRFAHDRDLAGPGYRAFKTPNSDTLYSNAWLDLTDGPVVIETPDVPLRYYTLNFLDMYANASNIGTRTFGSKAGRYLIAPANWRGAVPEGATLFRVGTPHTWVLLRVYAQNPAEVVTARAIQDQVKIKPLNSPGPKSDYPPPDITSAQGFFNILDYVLRKNGHPVQEDALIYRFRALGIGGPDVFEYARLDAEVRAGMDAGFADAMKTIEASRSQLGTPTETRWNRTQKARYGFNYLNRAVINYVGLGANVEEENLSFNTFTDGQGQALNAATRNYTLEVKPPPVNAFWSVTLYDGSNFELYPNELNRYVINARTPGLKLKPDGSVSISIQHERPDDPATWLPAPSGPFYIVIRSYLPKPDMISGGWRPEAIVALPKGSGE